MHDPYIILGVRRGATQTEITAAYKSLAKKYHPDLHPGDIRAAARMREINEAYDLLKVSTDTVMGTGPNAAGEKNSDFTPPGGGGGSWREYDDISAWEHAQHMAETVDQALRERKRAEQNKLVKRVFIWLCLITMLGSILFQACASAPMGFFLS